LIRRFLRDKGGNYALVGAISLVPLTGGVALAVDYSELLRQKQDTLNALDAAGIATAQQIVTGVSDTDAKAYAKTFFETNLAHVSPGNAVLSVTLPNNNAGGGTLKLCAALRYYPYFLPAAAILIGKTANDLTFTACSEVRLKNTLEVALVLDNSGSMSELGHGSSKVRFDLLKDAAKQLVDQLAGQAQMMKQISKPVQFSLVPFAASVNVGPTNQGAAWLDPNGISPVQHENFDWTTMSSSASPWGTAKYAQNVGGIWYAKGAGWGTTQQDKPLTRFSLYDQMTRVATTTTTTTCTGNGKNKVCTTTTTPATYSKVADWGGCVEARPYPYNVNDDAAASTTPATMFVPMFAPDEPGNKWTLSGTSVKTFNVVNSWWDDNDSSTGTTQTAQLARQKNMAKYFIPAPFNTAALPAPINGGPNYSCTPLR
jgi:Flp pilus assembly protein TadG